MQTSIVLFAIAIAIFFFGIAYMPVGRGKHYCTCEYTEDPSRPNHHLGIIAHVREDNPVCQVHHSKGGTPENNAD